MTPPNELFAGFVILAALAAMGWALGETVKLALYFSNREKGARNAETKPSR